MAAASSPPTTGAGRPLAAWALSSPVFDAHCHFEDARIWASREAWIMQAVEAGVTGFAVKGTSPEDWARVDEVCCEWDGRRVARGGGGDLGRDEASALVFVPSYGVHPWFLADVERRVGEAGEKDGRDREREASGSGADASWGEGTDGEAGDPAGAASAPSGPPSPRDHPLPALLSSRLRDRSWPALLAGRLRDRSWPALLAGRLRDRPGAHVGECGLDRTPRASGSSLETQLEAMRLHLGLAASLDRTVSLHCVRCAGALLGALTAGEFSGGSPRVILHSWQGSAEATRALARRPNTWFSLAPRTLRSVPAKAARMVRAVPLDALLLESDAPDGTGEAGEAWRGEIAGWADGGAGRGAEEEEEGSGGRTDGEQGASHSPEARDGRLGPFPIAVPGCPAALPLFARLLAAVRGEDPETLTRATFRNALRAFRIDGGAGGASP